MPVTHLKTRRLIRVGHSPDPDDAFMFHALANDCIDTAGYEFRHELVDIETLNRRAFDGELELTAVSIHAYAYLHDKYALCSCGASMGDGYGPMLVTRRDPTSEPGRPGPGGSPTKPSPSPAHSPAPSSPSASGLARTSNTSSSPSTRSSTSSREASTRASPSAPG